jgi:hypothetical protein
LDECQKPARLNWRDKLLATIRKETTMEGPLSFFLFFFVFVPFILINATNYIKERRKANEELQQLLRESNDLLRQILEKTS